jgi:hypothetical protein
MGILEQFYNCLKNDTTSFSKVHVPHSSVFYVKGALEARLGQEFTIEQVEKAMYAEGFLHPNDYGIPRWYQRKWMKRKSKKQNG